LHRDFQECLYAFDLKGEGLYLNGYAFNFMLKYKVEIEKLNYYSWAKFLEKINDESVVVKLLDKLELATPQRDDLSVFRQVLYQEFEQDTCFYCGKKLQEIHVDHFIPWSFIKEDKLWNFVLACPTCNIRKSNKIPKMEYVKLIQNRNDNLRKLNTSFVQNQFKTYKPQLISDMWKYAQSGGFVVM
jgi:5-methylcytosine-specific restriction endonuclease McrA